MELEKLLEEKIVLRNVLQSRLEKQAFQVTNFRYRIESDGKPELQSRVEKQAFQEVRKRIRNKLQELLGLQSRVEKQAFQVKMLRDLIM